MVKVKVGTMYESKELITSLDKTPLDLLNEAEVDYAHGTTHLDGAVLSAAEMNSTLAELGISEGNHRLVVIVKADAA